MKAAARAASANCTAGTAELQKGTAAAGSGKRRTGEKLQDDCRTTAEQLQKLSPVPDSLVQPFPPKMPREGAPADTPARRGAGWPVEAPPSLARGLPAHEQAVIDAALAILGQRVREPGAVFDAPHLVREFLRLHLGKCGRERFGVMFLDGQHALIAFEILFEGSLTQTSVYPREDVRRSLQLNAHAVVLAHNHPSGKAEPSLGDELLTRTLQAALRLVDVRLLDHVVIGWPDVASFAERGLMEPDPPALRAPRGRAVRELAGAGRRSSAAPA